MTKEKLRGGGTKDLSFTLVPFENSTDYQCRCDMHIQGHTLQLHYWLEGKIDELELFEVQSPGERKIGLWERTCFEFFVKLQGRSEYFEFNFSSAADWNCFHFPARGKDLNEFAGVKKIPISAHKEGLDQYHLTALINLKNLGDYFYSPGLMHANIAVVILHPKTGQREYWALEHLDKRPNFHNFNSFVANF